MKKLLALVLTLCLCFCVATFSANAEEPVSLRLVLVTYTTYNMEAPLANSIYEEIGKRLNIDLNIEWIAAEGADSKISTMLASNDLPDVFTSSIDTATLVNEGAIVALDDYLDKIPNYMKWINDVEANVRCASDGKLYNIYMYTDYKPAYAMTLRQDWMDRLGITTTPETIDEWIGVWKQFRDNDANGNGDPNDEIPFVDPQTFTSSYPGSSLLMLWGIRSNGLFYTDENGKYSMVFEHENYRDYLNLMRTLYSERLIDHEVFTHTDTDVANLFNSSVAGSGYQWITRPQNTTKTLADEGALLIPVPPIKGANGSQIIPQRNPLNALGFVVGYQTEQNGKLDAVLKLIDYMYSEEGVDLMNYGIEGVHHTVVDGVKTLNPDIVADSTFTTARHQGLVQQVFPGVWTQENYNTIMTKGMAPEEMDIWDQQMVKGTQIYWDYYFVMPVTLSTNAWATYNADVMTRISELRANCITGAISIDEFFAGYEALKAYGLQEILDEGQAAYDKMRDK